MEYVMTIAIELNYNFEPKVFWPWKKNSKKYLVSTYSRNIKFANLITCS